MNWPEALFASIACICLLGFFWLCLKADQPGTPKMPKIHTPVWTKGAPRPAPEDPPKSMRHPGNPETWEDQQ